MGITLPDGITAEDRRAVLEHVRRQKINRRRRRPRVLSLGTISSATLRTEDLIPAFVSVLEDLQLPRAARNEVRAIDRRASAADEDSDYWSGDESAEDLEQLQTIAESVAPDYCYVGSLEGDGAEIGVWPVSEILEDTRPGGYDGCIGRSDRSGNGPGPDTPAEYSHFLQVNDHGNATLYRRAGRRWIEVWSVV